MPTKILCVDDDRDTSDFLTTMLGVSGFEAACAFNMTSALRLMEGGEFSLYILDGYSSSSASELSLCEQVREVDKRTSIIIFSGHAHRSDIEAGMLAGANAYLVKPDTSELVSTVKRLLEAAPIVIL